MISELFPFVTVNTQQTFHTKLVAVTFRIYLCTKFHMPSFNGILPIVYATRLLTSVKEFGVIS
jgi:hypothetical protein